MKQYKTKSKVMRAMSLVSTLCILIFLGDYFFFHKLNVIISPIIGLVGGGLSIPDWIEIIKKKTSISGLYLVQLVGVILFMVFSIIILVFNIRGAP